MKKKLTQFNPYFDNYSLVLISLKKGFFSGTRTDSVSLPMIYWRRWCYLNFIQYWVYFLTSPDEVNWTKSEWRPMDIEIWSFGNLKTIGFFIYFKLFSPFDNSGTYYQKWSWASKRFCFFLLCSTRPWPKIWKCPWRKHLKYLFYFIESWKLDPSSPNNPVLDLEPMGFLLGRLFMPPLQAGKLLWNANISIWMSTLIGWIPIIRQNGSPQQNYFLKSRIIWYVWSLEIWGKLAYWPPTNC